MLFLFLVSRAATCCSMDQNINTYSPRDSHYSYHYKHSNSGVFLVIHLTDEINTNVHVDNFSKIFLKQGRNVDNVMTADSRGRCRADKNILV